MSKAENQENNPNLSAIDAKLAAEVKEKLGLEYPINNKEAQDKQNNVELMIKQMKSLAETDPICVALEEELNIFLGDGEEDLE